MVEIHVRVEPEAVHVVVGHAHMDTAVVEVLSAQPAHEGNRQKVGAKDCVYPVVPHKGEHFLHGSTGRFLAEVDKTALGAGVIREGKDHVHEPAHVLGAELVASAVECAKKGGAKAQDVRDKGLCRIGHGICYGPCHRAVAASGRGVEDENAVHCSLLGLPGTGLGSLFLAGLNMRLDLRAYLRTNLCT